MKATIILEDENGNRYKGEAVLQREQHEVGPASRKRRKVAAVATPPVTFDMNPRAFMKKYASGLSGAGRFTFLVALLAKGKIGVEVATAEVVKKWNSMTMLLGKWNTVHANRAKENDWVDSAKRGVYVLRPRWKEASGN